jgi:hypothetical protein
MPIDPNVIAQAALLALDGILKVIAQIRAQGGLTDDEIMAHAQASIPANSDLIKGYLASLPPTP